MCGAIFFCFFSAVLSYSTLNHKAEKMLFLFSFNLDLALRYDCKDRDISVMCKSMHVICPHSFRNQGWKIITKQLFEVIFAKRCFATFQDRDKKRDKSESVSNASSDESEIDMNETRRRMHAMLDDAFSLFGPQSSKKYGKEPERQPEPHPPAHPKAHPEAHPEGYPATPARQAVIPR